MGFAVSWVAISGKEPQRVLEELGLARTGEKEEFPESELTCASLPGSWFLVCVNEFDSPITSERVLSSLSVGCKLVSCQIEEHIMLSSATCYSNGSQSWRVEHDAQQSIYHLSTIGSPPPQLAEAHAKLQQEQDNAGGAGADVDYIFDVPVVVAQAITSYRHDMDIEGADSEPFEVLRQAVTARQTKPWWKLWQAQ
jgi:hypothetical protein